MTVVTRRRRALRAIYCSVWSRFAIVLTLLIGGFAIGTVWSFAGAIGLLVVLDRAERRYLPETERLPLIAFLAAAGVLGLVLGVLAVIAIVLALALA